MLKPGGMCVIRGHTVKHTCIELGLITNKVGEIEWFAPVVPRFSCLPLSANFLLLADKMAFMAFLFLYI